MSSRDQILADLRRNAPPAVPLPDLPAGIDYVDAEQQFAETLASVGGKFIRAAELTTDILRTVEAYAGAHRIVSLIPGVGDPDIDVAALQDPHELEGVDVAILAGEFAVAENAAVWIPGSALGPHRAVFVITQHLILAVPAGAVVHNMHQAYARIQANRTGFGVFISGPSKTADIEQSLVIGAHGARSCTVIVHGPEPC